ncbi:MAG: S8 family peptidase [Agathobacter sp.]
MDRVKRLIQAERVYRQGYSGKNIRIAVLDTGVFLHRDIRSNVVYFKDFVGGRRLSYDDNGHGTHVAGIIAGNGKQKGIAPQAKLVVLKVLEKDGGGNTNRVLQALDWVLSNRERYQIRILNFSIGFLPGSKGSEQKQIVEGLERLWDENVTVVTAAGNNGPGKGSITVPGISRKVITVGASDDTTGSVGLPKSYSGQGPTECCVMKPEILAPGTDIVSLDHRGNHYVRKSGTSMAAPVVSGALALALQKNPHLRPEELKVKLYESAGRQENGKSAWGILQVDKLMDLI